MDQPLKPLFTKLFVLVTIIFTGGLAAAPLDDMKTLAKSHDPMVVFEVPGTVFDCLRKADYEAMGREVVYMRSINGLGCKAIINNWMGAEVRPDGLEWWFVAHGGHNAYGGNEAYRLVLTDEIPWSLHSLPSPRARFEIAETGEVTFLEDVQWTGCPDGVRAMKPKRQKIGARSCTKYGPGAIHTWSLPAYMNGKIYMHGWASFGSRIHQGAWIFDPEKACIEAARAALIPNLDRLNPQNISADCDPTAAWTYLGQRGPGIATPLPTKNRILYSWQHASQGVLEDADGLVLRESGAFGGSSPYSSVHTQWIPSLKKGVINKLAQRWFYVSPEGEVRSPKGKKGSQAYARVDTSIATKKVSGHFSYDPGTEDFLILQDTDLFRIARKDLEDDDRAELSPVSLDWSRIDNPDPKPYKGFVYVEAANVHCMMNRGNLGQQFLMCFRYH